MAGDSALQGDSSRPAAAAEAVRTRGRVPIVTAVGALVLGSILVDLLFFTGYFASDDRTYYFTALDILETGRVEDFGLGGMRLTIVGWNMLMILLLGANVQLVAASYVVFHQLTVLCTFLLGRRLLDARAGLLAAYLTAAFPVIVMYTSMILPDVMLGLFCLLSLLAYLRSRELRIEQPGRAWLLFFACGSFVGLGYMTKETALVLLPFFFLAWLTSIRPRAIARSIVHGSAFAIGFFVIFFAEYGALSYLSGRSFWRMSWTVDTPADIAARSQRYGFEPLERLEWVERQLSDDVWPDPMKATAIAALLIFPLWPRRCFSVPLMGLWLFAFLTFGSMSLTQYVPPSIQARYYIPVVPIGTALTGSLGIRLFDLVFKHGLLSNVWVRRTAATLSVLVLLLAGLSAQRGPDAQAGKLYKSDIVRSTADAASVATHGASRPVVLSGTLAHYAEPVYPGPNTPQSAARADEAALEEWLGEGGFSYIELANQAMRREGRWMRAGLGDRFVWPFLQEYLHPPDIPIAPEVPAGVFRRIDSAQSGQLVFGSRIYDVVVDETGRFTEPKSRTASLAAATLALPNLDTGDDPTAVPVVLYHVSARRARSQERRAQHETIDLGASVRESGDRRGAALWRVSGPHISLEGSADDWRLHSSLRRRKYAWLRPSRPLSEAMFQLEPERRYEVTLNVRISGDMELELLIDGLKSLEDAEPVGRLRLRLNSGRTRFGICTSRSSHHYEPLFKIIGPGYLAITEFRITPAD